MALRVDYYFKETFQGLKRNGLVAFAAVSSAFIALFLVGGALLVQREVGLLIARTEANVEVSVFLRDDVSPTQQANLGNVLNQMPEVASVHYESKTEAYRRFQDIFKNQKALVENVSPDSLPASFRVKLKDPQKFDVVAARLTGQSGIDKIVDQRNILKRLFAVIRVFRVGVLAVAVVMLVSAAALIGNTVRLAVFNRRKEIGIMRLVGATNWHIRLPFLIEGVIEGLLGASAAVLGLFIMKVAFIDSLRGKVGFLPLVGTANITSGVPTSGRKPTFPLRLSMKATFMMNRPRTAADAPRSPSITPPIKKGSRMCQFVAPTNRMIPISLRRLNTARRTVLPISAAADTSITTATANTPTRNTRITANSRFRICRWSTILSIPGWPTSRSATTVNCWGSLSFTRKDAGRASGVMFSTSAIWFLKIFTNRWYASCRDSKWTEATSGMCARRSPMCDCCWGLMSFCRKTETSTSLVVKSINRFTSRLTRSAPPTRKRAMKAVETAANATRPLRRSPWSVSLKK